MLGENAIMAGSPGGGFEQLHVGGEGSGQLPR